jgi:C4-dicarboxylate transporter, DctM subunit
MPLQTEEGFPKEQPFAVRRLLRALRESALALMAPVVILGGIWGGVFTPTEAAAVAVGYSLVVGLLVYRELKLRELPKILLDTAVLATSIMFIMGAATILAWVLTYAEVPDMVAHAAAGLQDPYLFLLIVNLLVLFVGMWMDPTATIVVLTPILLPIAVSLGVHPVHFGVVFVYNLMIGMVTPPVGYVLYITSAIGTSPSSPMRPGW